MKDHWMAFWLAMVVGIPLALYTNFVDAFAAVPPGDMLVTEAEFPNPSHDYLLVEFPLYSKYVSPESTVSQRAAILAPRNPVGKVGIRIRANGWSATEAYCYGVDFSDSRYIVIKMCHDHYPGANLYEHPYGWGGAFGGENYLGWRMAAILKYVYERYGHIIDHSAGVNLQGFSYAGQMAHFQSMIMPDLWAKALITVVEAGGYSTLPFRQDDPVGIFFRDGSGVPEAWAGFDWTQADIRTKSVPGQYHNVSCSPNDNIVSCDIDYWRLVCDDQRRPCFGLRHGAGHGAPPGDLHLPFGWLYTDMGMSHRLNQPQIAFSDSTANWWGVTGHYNLGLAWQDAGMVSTKTSVEIPLRYGRWTNIGYDVPDQPLSVTFNATIRNTKMSLKVGNVVFWSLGAQTGTAVVAVSGEVTIPGLELNSGPIYQNLRVWR